MSKHRGRWRACYLGADGLRHERAIPQGTPARERLAYAHELERREERIRDGLEVRLSIETLAAASARYLFAIRGQKSQPLLASLWANQLLPVLGAVPVGQFRPTQVDEFLQQMEEEGYAPHTRIRVRSALSACYEWLLLDGTAATNPVRRSKRIRAPRVQPKVLTEERVLALARAASFPGLRHMVLMAYYSACRPGELLAATWADIRFPSAEETRATAARGKEASGELNVSRTVGSNTTKTGRSRVVSLPPPALSLLAEMRLTAQGQHLFLNRDGRPMKHRAMAEALKVALVRAGFVRGWESVCRRGGRAAKGILPCGYVGAGKPEPKERCPRCGHLLDARALPIHFSPKGFRSSSITQIVETTGSVKAAAEQAGHRRTSTTEGHYVEVSKPYVADAVSRAFTRAPDAQPAHSAGPACLSQWFAFAEVSSADVAAELGASPQDVTAWLKGATLPPRMARLALEALSDGAVPVSAWEPIPESASPVVH